MAVPLVRVLAMGWEDRAGETVAVTNGLETWVRWLGPFLSEYAPV